VAVRGRRAPLRPSTLEVAALFWHFVDFAWVPIFTFLYLVPAR
jgi:heme/copper-type cytochrome/quinol oxidase subunit 3